MKKNTRVLYFPREQALSHQMSKEDCGEGVKTGMEDDAWVTHGR